jgi:hypothetical protein
VDEGIGGWVDGEGGFFEEVSDEGVAEVGWGEGGDEAEGEAEGQVRQGSHVGDSRGARSARMRSVAVRARVRAWRPGGSMVK